jgi:RNA processing factor Prp31
MSLSRHIATVISISARVDVSKTKSSCLMSRLLEIAREVTHRLARMEDLAERPKPFTLMH